ncbi:MAG: MarR family transcriptional regulator [Pigmentiphaga sp.]|uniref:MarR family winged helix-turn-helix transcriptional regulator n=1 Tax=Pigmentiphaga sp. TaxID=1977564 RepID=UPI0029A8420F|nr:MarR family transcriptional regulator [Pigmentiphaga sp.]MDX3905116.1 MarR family transcriptional regulator [Pigmentiphaga sp.]
MATNRPWETLSADGADIPIEQFVTTLVPQLASLMRRNVTGVYARQHGLTVPQWRLLALIARYSPLPFTDAVTLSGLDKGQISRTLRELQSSGLCTVEPDSSGNKKKVVCVISKAGLDRYQALVPVAQRKQVDLLAALSQSERRALYTSLIKLMQRCENP